MAIKLQSSVRVSVNAKSRSENEAILYDLQKQSSMLRGGDVDSLGGTSQLNVGKGKRYTYQQVADEIGTLGYKDASTGSEVRTLKKGDVTLTVAPSSNGNSVIVEVQG